MWMFFSALAAMNNHASLDIRDGRPLEYHETNLPLYRSYSLKSRRTNFWLDYRHSTYIIIVAMQQVGHDGAFDDSGILRIRTSTAIS